MENIDSVPPRFSYSGGVTIILIFSFFIGMWVTISEPALTVLGMAAKNLSDGRIQKWHLIMSICIGVSGGITVGIVKIIFNVELIYLLIPSYFIALILSIFSSEEFVNIAWDCAGATTGPITAPLVMVLGVAFGNRMGTNGFGILSLASVGPIISTLILGIILEKNKKINNK